MDSDYSYFLTKAGYSPCLPRKLQTTKVTKKIVESSEKIVPKRRYFQYW